MIYYYRYFKAALVFVVLLGPMLASATVKLPRLVSDNMVLQRNAKVNIWGWASPQEEVTVHFIDNIIKTVASPKGEWKITLPVMQAGGPYVMTIEGQNTITINNILIGEVWLCGGQSNMEFRLSKVKDRYAADIADASKYPIREFAVKEKYGYDKVADVEGNWEVCTPETVLHFTAVGYFFAQSLYSKLKVPIGLIYSSWPGTPAEAWISEEGLKPFPHYIEQLSAFKDTGKVNAILLKEKLLVSNWHENVRQNDAGSAPGQTPWSQTLADTLGWKPLNFPGFWESQSLGKIDGVVWVKKVINIPVSMVGKDLTCSLGMIDDMDSTYFNGRFIGTTNNKYNPRSYKIPAGLVKAGANVIVVRITDTDGNGGMISGKTYDLTDGNTHINLGGQWLYKVGYATNPLPVQSFLRIHYKPGILYRTMIEPLTNYTIKGALWYQGEANTGPDKAFEYRKLLPVMINEWRTAWRQGNFPFLIVQLANYGAAPINPQSSNWALLRESQSVVAATIPNSGLTVTIDVGEANDIHPSNKKDVGIRLALSARYVAYQDKQVLASGPTYKSMKIEAGKIVLQFNRVGKGLYAKGGELKQFAIAAADQQFVWANAKISGDKIIVWSDKVTSPIAVRYAWADNPEGCNLYNSGNLPASPFRTDSWAK